MAASGTKTASLRYDRLGLSSLSLYDQSGEGFVGWFEVEDFPCPVVETLGDGVEVLLAVAGGVGALGEIGVSQGGDEGESENRADEDVEF